MAERRPGFNLDTTFKTHLSTVKLARFNAKHGSFLSLDEKSFKAWTVQADGSCSLFHDSTFPGFQSNFITALTVSTEPLNLIFAACLDGNLRLYSEKMQLRSTMPWSSGAVRDMVFNPRRNELITAGSYGVKAWRCELDHDAYHSDKHVDPYSIPRTQDGSVIPWGFGRYQHARQRIQYRVPGARAIGTGSKQDASIASVGNCDWCEHVQLHEPTNTLFALLQGSVYGFDADTGVLHMSFTDLHALPITSLVYSPDSDTLITATLDDGVTIWRIANGIPHRFTSFGKSITYMVPDDHHNPTCLLTTSSDGLVTFWSLEGGQPLYRMRLAAPVGGLPVFFAPNRFLLHIGCEIRLFSIQRVGELWTECNAAPTRLQVLPGSGGLILAEYADSSIRILDATSQQVDKSIVTLPPQLSSSSLQTATVSLCCARLYALLTSGELHVWRITRGRPPQWLTAWPHLMREHCCSMDIIERGSVKPVPRPTRGGAAVLNNQLYQSDVVVALNLNFNNTTGAVHEHLVLGCTSGDILVVDAEQAGAITCRFPAFRQQPVQKVKLRLDGNKPLLLAVARCCLKVWGLEEQIKCMHVLDTSQQITVLELLANQVLLGTSSGSVHLVDIDTGQASAPASSLDHLDQVTSCGASEQLQHLVTCAKDSHIKVFNASKVLVCSVYLGACPAACCYLNNLGDILVAIQRKLLVVSASVCQALAGEEDSGLPAPPLYPTASARMHVTRPIHPTLTGATGTTAGGTAVSHNAQLDATGNQPQQNSPRTTPLPAVTTRAGSAGSQASGTALQRPSSSDKDSGSARELNTPSQASAPSLPELSTSSKPSTSSSRSGQQRKQQPGWPSRASVTSSFSTSSSSTPILKQRGGPASAKSPPRKSAGASKQHGVKMSVAVARDESSEDEGSQASRGQQEAVQGGIRTVGADSTGSGHMTYSVTPEPGQTSHDLGDADPVGAGVSGLSDDASSSGGDDSSSTSTSSSSDSSSDDDDDDDDDETGSDSGDDSVDEAAKKAALIQAQRELLQTYKAMKLPFQTAFKLDLAGEQHKQQRRRFGLQPDANSAPALSVQTSQAAAATAGALPPDEDEIEASAAQWEAVTGGYTEEDHKSDQETGGNDQQGRDALAARFKKLLVLLSSESMLLDEPLPPELQALLDQGPARGKKLKKKKKKTKKEPGAGKSSKVSKQQSSKPLRASPASPAVAPTNTAGMLSLPGSRQASRQAPSTAGSHKLPSLSSVLSGRPMGAALACIPVQPVSPPRTGTTAADEGKAKKRKKKGKRSKRRHKSDLEFLDPAKYLASVTRDSSVLIELQMLNKHQMLTRVRDVDVGYPASRRASPAKPTKASTPPTTAPSPALKPRDEGEAGDGGGDLAALDVVPETASGRNLAKARTALSFKAVMKAVQDHWGTPPPVKPVTKPRSRQSERRKCPDSITDAPIRAKFDF